MLMTHRLGTVCSIKSHNLRDESNTQPKMSRLKATSHHHQPQLQRQVGHLKILPVRQIYKNIENAPPASPVPPRNATSSGRGRGGRIPKRFVPQATKIESVDDPMGPLGPLGDNFAPSEPSEEPLVSPLPQVTQAQSGKHVGSSNASLRTLMSSVNIDDDEELSSSSKARVPPPVHLPPPESPQRQTQPSVSIVEAAKPTFRISVGDPHKVGDITSVHTEYQVSTRVMTFIIVTSTTLNVLDKFESLP
jgi:hypothetical protein